MRRFILFCLVIAAAYYSYSHIPSLDQGSHAQPTTHQTASHQSTDDSSDRSTTHDAIASAFAKHQSNLQIQGGGVVQKILSDDNEGSRHQRFIVRLPSGQTVLIAHNIDLAPRVAPLQLGDHVDFFGEYAWNEQGGVVHWTHRDPNGRHQAGWIERAGAKFQ